MHLFSFRHSALLLLACGLLGGCSNSESMTQASVPDNPPSPVATAPSPEPDATPIAPDPAQQLAEAEAQATQAAMLAESAQSRDDWALVVSRWERAIALLDAIPDEAEMAAQARQTADTYRQNLATAQGQADRPVSQTAVRLDRSAEAAENAAEADEAAPAETEATSPESTTPIVALANHLNQIGARMYGTYWCSYCRQQRELFSPDAAAQFEQLEIECDARGTNPQVDACRAAGVASFPTWEINGQTYRGLQSLNDLANASGYEGSREFTN